MLDANGDKVLTWSQVQARAWEFFDRCQRGVVGKQSAPFTVTMAFDAYWVYRELHKPKGVSSDLAAVKAHILPIFGPIEVRSLTQDQIQGWLEARATAPRHKRTAKGDKQVVDDTPLTEDQKRARKFSANRLLAIFKSCLNLAVQSRKHHGLTSDEWVHVKPFRNVVKARVRFLDESAAEQVRLVNACPPDFRDLVRGGLLTGARYSELAQVRCEDFRRDNATLYIDGSISKSGKSRYVHLTDEGVQLFSQRSRGRAPDDWILTKDNGNPWRRGHQQRLFNDACDAAGIKGATACSGEIESGVSQKHSG